MSTPVAATAAAASVNDIEDTQLGDDMWCFQCQQTAKNEGCQIRGVCGKDPELSALMDLCIMCMRGLSMYAVRLYDMGEKDEVAYRRWGHFIADTLFMTLTQVNYHHQKFRDTIFKACAFRDEARAMYLAACRQRRKTPDDLTGTAAMIVPARDPKTMYKQGKRAGYKQRCRETDKEIVNLQEFLLFGLKGICAYYHHGLSMKFEDMRIIEHLFRNLEVQTRRGMTINDMVEALLECGRINFITLEFLDRAHHTTFGHPTPAQVRTTPVAGKCIIVSGHDLWDLYTLLQQTEGKGINVYTHGEEEPAHGYPGLRKFKHLIGNLGGAWHDQKEIFKGFPGAILLTSNCMLKPLKSYKARMFQTGPTGLPDGYYISEGPNGQKDWTPVIQAALAAPGFATTEADPRYSNVGFGHNTILSLAGEIVKAVKEGNIKHFFVVGGCDAPTTVRDYYTQFCEAVPDDCLILTMGCGKYRLKRIEHTSGTIPSLGIPRILNMGQCNDAYTALKVGIALADAFKCNVNELPLSLNISWVEQKAIADVLTIFYLGIQNVRLGPTLPAFITPTTLKIFQERFSVKPITNVMNDLATMMAKEDMDKRGAWLKVLESMKQDREERLAREAAGLDAPAVTAAPVALTLPGLIKTRPRFTMEEVARHNDLKSGWIVVHDKVYDVTEYIENHPGGPAILSRALGTDATGKFELVGHSPAARDYMGKMYIGDIKRETPASKF